MSDLIKREDAIDAIGADIDEIDALDPSAGIKKACIRRAIWKVMGAPTIDRPQGEWVHSHEGTIAEGLYCSNCGKHGHGEKFCPHCDARMKGADDE